MEIEIICNLMKIRESKNISIRQLERMSGISKSQISNIEMGTHDATIKTAYRIARALNVDLWVLYSFPERNK